MVTDPTDEPDFDRARHPLDEVEAQPVTTVRCPFPNCSVVGQSVGGVRRHITAVHRVDGRTFDISPQMMHGATVYGPNAEKVRLLFYADGSMRLRVAEAGPMKISEAFLPRRGQERHHQARQGLIPFGTHA